tara:strand:+ start:3957 stop:4379 length:423 start_codon:yes stop_codon:yes gene_type:complete
MKEFKEGDWVFCEFKLQRIKKMEDGRVTGVYDGMFEHSGRDLSERCFHLDMKVKRCSDEAKSWSDKFHKLGNPGLNHPGLKNALVSKWAALCELAIAEENDFNKGLFDVAWEDLHKFGTDVVNRINDLEYEKVSGVKLFR